MGAFSINDLIYIKSRPAKAEEYKEIWLSPYDVKEAEENTHVTLEGIEELADSFLHVGQEQPTVLARVNGDFKIIDGHRRNAANILNLKRGHKEYDKVLYRYKDMSPAMYELSLLAGNGFTQPLTPAEKIRLAERIKAALIRAREEDGMEIQGKMRDLIAGMLNESSTNVARMESISNNASPELKKQIKNGTMGITAAYEAAKLPKEEQREIAGKAAEGETIRAKDIAERVKEKKEAEEQLKAVQAAADKAEKAAEKSRDCLIASSQAALQAERAAEASQVSESDTKEPGQEEIKAEAVFTLQELLIEAGKITYNELLVLQDILVKCNNRKREK